MVKLAAGLLTPGRAIDLGCGDGKNMLYLLDRGWSVHGIELSPAAARAAKTEIAGAGHASSGRVICGDVVGMDLGESCCDLLICYGLYHCLEDQELEMVHSASSRALRPGGLFALAVFNDELPVPEEHYTGQLHLRPREHVFSLLPGWRVLAQEFGTVRESHPPLVGEHTHSLSWALLEKGDAM